MAPKVYPGTAPGPQRDGVAREPRTPSSAWHPLHHALFRRLWIATLASNIGTWMHEVGAGWLMTALAPSPLMVGLVQSATTLPIVLLALPAGALADIVDRRRYLLLTQLWMLLAATGLGVCTLLGITTARLLLLFTFLLGCGTAMTLPAWSAIVPALVPRSDLQLAITLNGLGINVSRAIGPALAGFLIAATGPGAVFLLNAASFLGVLGVLLRWRRAPHASSLPAERWLGAMRAGLRYARHSGALQAVLVRGAAFFLFASALWALLPLLVREELVAGPVTYGVLLGGIGAGAVLMAFALPRLRTRLKRDHLVALASAGYALTLLALAYLRNVYLLGAVMLMTGATWISVMSSLQVAAQVALPEWVRARGLSVFTVVFMSGMAGGGLLWGYLASFIGMRLTFAIAAAGLLLGLAVTWRFRMSGHEALDLTPSMHWPAPLVGAEPEPDQGPVLVTLEYRVDPAKVDEFLRLMPQLRRMRRRDNAFFWELFCDTADANRFLECFMVESWTEHLRQHARVTFMDKAIQDELMTYLVDTSGPIVAHHVSVKIP